MGVLDETNRGENVGCEHLLRAARRCRPRLYCFGHIHEGWGAQRVQWNDSDELDIKIEEQIEAVEAMHVRHELVKEKRAATVDISRDGDTVVEFGKHTLMVNASIMNVQYKPWNAPWLIDLDLEMAK